VTASDGTHIALPEREHPRNVYSSEAAFLVTDILSDAAARRPAFGSAFRFPFACAVKTGTTKDYKDNWTVGYTSRYTVGVWAGNFNGSPMQGVSGVTGAGQIFTDIMTLLHSAPYGTLPDRFTVPDGVEQQTLCPRSGKAPTRACPYHAVDWVMKKNAAAAGACTVHRGFIVRDERGIPAARVYELYPPEYAAWQQSKHMPVPPADAVPAERAAGSADSRGPRLAIASPNNGDVFKIDPSLRREYQTMTIHGFSPTGAADVKLTIDNTGSMPFPANGFSWKLQKGVHRFQLFCTVHSQQLESKVVSITVE
jgi:penicillin-binding protein 1C